jgi:single-stranded DNA-specific DHH superfamily exonuclease
LSNHPGCANLLIIHHWDTDGICSAAKLIKILKPEKYTNLSPPIGEFKFDERIYQAIEEHDEIYVVDLNLPDFVENVNKKVTFIDHHHQEQIENENV